MTFSREEVARACRAWGKMLWVPPGIDCIRLLWALSGNESSFGLNATPRHEPAYDVGGAYAKNPEQAALLATYGSSGACSYGAWQLMLVNCAQGTSPDDMERVDRCALETVRFINARILKGEGATTIAEIAEAYNSGKWRWMEVPPGVATYAADCVKYYDTEPMPSAPIAAAAATAVPVSQTQH